MNGSLGEARAGHRGHQRCQRGGRFALREAGARVLTTADAVAGSDASLCGGKGRAVELQQGPVQESLMTRSWHSPRPPRKAQEVADLVAFLASPTGTEYVIDGGTVATV
jgi:hypothetical protein